MTRPHSRARREWFARQDDLRDEVNEQRRQQWEHRRHFHWDPDQLTNVAGSVRMWERDPGSEAFAVVRVGHRWGQRCAGIRLR